MAEPSQDIVISIPSGFDATQREQIGEEVVRFIVQRTRKGLDIDNKRFSGYSDSYKNSLDFKNAGKSNKVNLTLTGEMLNTIELKNHGPGFLKIGLEDTDDNDKAAWNSRNGRLFLGISKADLNSILSGFSNRSESEQLRTDIAGGIASSFIRRLVSGE